MKLADFFVPMIDQRLIVKGVYPFHVLVYTSTMGFGNRFEAERRG